MLTDWGAHHLDVTQWALNTEQPGPKTIDGSKTVLPNIPGGYTTPKHPLVTYQYPGDITVEVVAGDEGVLFEGESGRIFVNRGRITGKPIEEQDADAPLKEKIMSDVKALFKGNLAKLGDHMGNFFEGFKHNLPVISDVESQHRTVSRLPSGQHLDPAGAQNRVGRRKGTDRRRQRGQCACCGASSGPPTRFLPAHKRLQARCGERSRSEEAASLARFIALRHDTKTRKGFLIMSRAALNRRQFVQTTAGLAAAANLPHWFSQRAIAEESKNDRPIFGCIGLAKQGTYIAKRAKDNGADVVAVCDVWRKQAEAAKGEHFEKADIYEDYRKLLDRKDIEAVTIGTPDHWHTAIALAALDAGKHVYCEKPLTLTIDEGKQLVAAVKRTGKTFQVGTQQRGDQYTLFGRAVATVRSGQLGKIKKVTVHLPDHHLEAKAFSPAPIPEGMNWDFWLGQAPAVEYVPERCHYTFRWWYDYSGGLLTDWGAHHLDIAQWGLNTENSGPHTSMGPRPCFPTFRADIRRRETRSSNSNIPATSRSRW